MKRQYHLLIVDDDDATLKPYQTFFEKNGFHVETAHDGREALDKLRANDFDATRHGWHSYD